MFQGRYGNDYLNRALCFIAIAVTIVNMFLQFIFGFSIITQLLGIVSTVLLIVVFVRMFSKNFQARQLENQRFMKMWGDFQSTWQRRKQGGGAQAKTAKKNPTFEERRKHKYLVCPQCTQRLRVPRGKGKIRVTCTRCANKFEAKT